MRPERNGLSDQAGQSVSQRDLVETGLVHGATDGFCVRLDEGRRVRLGRLNTERDEYNGCDRGEGRDEHAL